MIGELQDYSPANLAFRFLQDFCLARRFSSFSRCSIPLSAAAVVVMREQSIIEPVRGQLPEFVSAIRSAASSQRILRGHFLEFGSQMPLSPVEARLRYAYKRGVEWTYKRPIGQAHPGRALPFPL